ncbi:MAG: hypothetical protein IJ595_09390, partial [Oscillospiraceae bacterium]|nr:hypothetical protein [Oscillospiraceae bacterium]
MGKKNIDLEALLSGDYDEDEEDYGYEDYEEYIVDDIYTDRDIDDTVIPQGIDVPFGLDSDIVEEDETYVRL